MTTAPPRSSAGPGRSPAASWATRPSSIRIQPRSVLRRGVVHRHKVGVREGRHRDANRTVLPMEILTPRSLAEALELKAGDPRGVADPGGHGRDGCAQLRPRQSPHSPRRDWPSGVDRNGTALPRLETTQASSTASNCRAAIRSRASVDREDLSSSQRTSGAAAGVKVILN